MIALILSLWISSAYAWTAFDRELTPGAVDPAATVAKVCTHGYTKTIRNVPKREKREVIAAYMAKYPAWPPPPYEFDHLISLEIGGSNEPTNLWPEPLGEARRKDVIENRLHRAVCRGEITLKDAQRRILEWQKELDE
jgi:hypothetical protein